MKSGTTSLHYYLGEHPQIQKLPAMKETNFFSGPPDAIPYPAGSKRIERLEEYERLFDPAFEVRGEASPCYTLHPRRRGVPERVKELIPDVKLIYVVRDPVARAISQYHFNASVEGEQRTLTEALSDPDPTSLYTCPGFYARQLERYLSHFPQENTLVIDQTDLLTDRAVTMSEIFRFLAVEHAFVSPQLDKEMNTGTELRTYSSYVKVRRRLMTSVPLLHRLPRGARRALRRSAQRVLSQPLAHQPANDDLLCHLRELYAADAGRLRLLTGKAFSTWSV